MKGRGSGKGHSPRPKSISEEDFSKKYDQAFGKKLPWWATDEHKKWVMKIEKENESSIKEPDQS